MVNAVVTAGDGFIAWQLVSGLLISRSSVTAFSFGTGTRNPGDGVDRWTAKKGIHRTVNRPLENRCYPEESRN